MQTAPKASLAYKIAAQLGEGAFWNHQTEELYWVDIESKKFHVYNPDKQTNRSYDCPSRVGTVTPTTDKNRAILALEDGIHFIDLNDGALSLHCPLENDRPNVRFNDGKCDPAGRLWAGSMHLDQIKGEANLYMIDQKGKGTLKLEGVTISNGIVWTKDKKTMYYIDTPSGQVVAYDYDNTTGAISNKTVAVEIPESLGYPDGMCIDANDNIWIGLWNGESVVCFDPRSGKMLNQIPVPAHNVTACAFGGPKLDTLYITSSSLDMSDDEKARYPDAGSIFKIVPGIKGVKSSFFICDEKN